MDHAQPPAVPTSSELDTALEFLADFGSGLANGMTNHAPMVVEALEMLGRPDAIADWIECNRSALRPWPPAVLPIEDWDTALGDWQRVSDWRVLFEDELTDGDWRAVVARWVPRLAAGASAHALHGLIRTAHAVRSLGRSATAARRGELAGALASWAAAYAELPVAPNAEALELVSPEMALGGLSFLPADRRRNGGSIVAGVGQLSIDDDFARAYHWPLFEDAEAAARGFGGLFAQVLVANANSTLHAIVFTHAVTGSAAALHLAPLISKADARALVRHVWHAGCALYAVYGSHPPAAAAVADQPLDVLVNRAVSSGDDHAIKLAEAVTALAIPLDLAGATLQQVLRHL